MTLVEINWQPDRKALKRFSASWLIFFGLILGPLALVNDRDALFYSFCIIGVAGWLFGAIRPEVLRLPFVVLNVVTFPVGWAFAYGLLAVAFFLLLTPMGLIGRLLGRDALSRRFDPTKTTYWEPHRPRESLARYLRQF